MRKYQLVFIDELEDGAIKPFAYIYLNGRPLDKIRYIGCQEFDAQDTIGSFVNQRMRQEVNELENWDKPQFDLSCSLRRYLDDDFYKLLTERELQ